MLYELQLIVRKQSGDKETKVLHSNSPIPTMHRVGETTRIDGAALRIEERYIEYESGQNPVCRTILICSDK